MTKTPPPIKWHSIFAAMLRELLTPLQIRVFDEFALTGEVDIILIQLLEGQRWTEEQRQYLPDGLRDSVATHLLIEFKYTQSLEEQSFRQAIAYDTLYRQQLAQQQLPSQAIQTFIVSAITPKAETLRQFGYEPIGQAGVYRSQDTFLQHIPLILLNQLGHEQYNAFFKLFASRRKVKLAAMETLKRWGLRQLQGKLFWLINGLLNLWFKQGDEIMEAITAETLIEDGKRIMEWLEPLLTEEDVLQLPVGQRIYLQGQNAGVVQGRKEGQEEGARQEAMALLLRTLTRRFGPVPAELMTRLQPLTLIQLRQVIDLAFDAQNVNDFEINLNQI